MLRLLMCPTVPTYNSFYVSCILVTQKQTHQCSDILYAVRTAAMNQLWPYLTFFRKMYLLPLGWCMHAYILVYVCIAVWGMLVETRGGCWLSSSIFLPPLFDTKSFYWTWGLPTLPTWLADQATLGIHLFPKTGVRDVTHYHLVFCRSWDWVPVVVFAWAALSPLSQTL